MDGGFMITVFENVGLRYGAEHQVFAGVDFALDRGGFFFLTGPSGAGKSSLLRLVYGAEKPQGGQVFLFGRDVARTSRRQLAALRRQIGVVFQDFRLIPHLTAFENAALPLRLAGADEKYVHRHTKELLEWVGVGGRMDALPAELSGGEQQRIAIARAVVNKPKLLLADEPSGNVDDDNALKLFHLFNELNKLGTAVIVATHHQNMIDHFQKPILRLAGGRLLVPTARAA
jgi:cell division transport system ATP-binding protein